MSDALSGLSKSQDPNLLIGFEDRDDAAVYRVSDDIAIVSTVDFITPPVDEPWWFGQIAAANAISDIYSMGGWPLTALNVVMFPEGKLDIGVLREILQGGEAKVAESGASMAGGHTIDDPEPKYGLAVTGMVDPNKIIKNTGIKPGDALVLTKPIGSGVLFNARRSGRLSFNDIESMLNSVATLNDKAMDHALQKDIHACTDITGFGIIGHIMEMTQDSAIDVEIKFNDIPVFERAIDMYRLGETTMANAANRMLSSAYLSMDANLTEAEEEILFDPQTSGGLIIALPESQAEGLIYDIKVRGYEDACIIGHAHNQGVGTIRVS